LIAVNHGVDEKTFQFFLPPPKTGTLAGTSIFPEAKKVVFHTFQVSFPVCKKAHCEIEYRFFVNVEIEFPVRETGFGVNKKKQSFI
jgi:hypothetical protein